MFGQYNDAEAEPLSSEKFEARKRYRKRFHSDGQGAVNRGHSYIGFAHQRGVRAVRRGFEMEMRGAMPA
jgi:hypothetical protein